jgi:hypothetical protein
MTTMQHQPPPPHDFETNIVRISTWRNVQKVRKPNVNIALRNKSYWDLRGRWQHEYDVRLDALPDDGIAITVRLLCVSPVSSLSFFFLLIYLFLNYPLLSLFFNVHV